VNIDAQRDTHALTQARSAAGPASEVDVAQARGQLATTESQVPLLRARGSTQAIAWPSSSAWPPALSTPSLPPSANPRTSGYAGSLSPSAGAATSKALTTPERSAK
jgi:hypothetical protein